MTTEKAIELLVNATYSDEWQGNEELTTALHMAIDALERPKTIGKKELIELINQATDEHSKKCEKCDMDGARCFDCTNKFIADYLISHGVTAIV